MFINDVYGSPSAFHGSTVLLAVLSYSIQIYFDFSGYSDMAIGCAKMMGYDFNRNFNMPYISRNVTEFWKRWHISLSSWLQEYLYYSLGGNRKGEGRRYVNLLITMLLGGLWHGAGWNFVIWGGLHGIGLCVHKLYLRFRRKERVSSLGNLVSILSTFVFVSICWIFFRAESFIVAKDVLRQIFVWDSGIIQPYTWSFIAVILLLIATIVPYVRRSGEKDINGFYPILNLNRFWSLVVFLFTIGMILGLAYTNSNPFIYFQF